MYGFVISLDDVEATRGEFLLVENPDMARESLLAAALSYTFLHAAKVRLECRRLYSKDRSLVILTLSGNDFRLIKSSLNFYAVFSVGECKI